VSTSLLKQHHDERIILTTIASMTRCMDRVCWAPYCCCVCLAGNLGWLRFASKNPSSNEPTLCGGVCSRHKSDRFSTTQCITMNGSCVCDAPLWCLPQWGFVCSPALHGCGESCSGEATQQQQQQQSYGSVSAVHG
jgi:hypothetical protein